MSPFLLVAFMAGLAFVGAPRLAAASWVLRAPRLAVLTWLAGSGALLLSAVLIGLTLLLYWDRTHDLVKGAWHVCLDALLGRHDGPAQAAAVTGLAGLILLTGRLAVSAARMVAAQRTRRAQLRLMVRLAATPSGIPGATVIRYHEPAAYLMPGRSMPANAADIVITSAAVDRLGASELSAVLAHERAHHAGHHYELTHWMRLLVQAFPHVRCFQLGRRQIDRLVELCADDAASRGAARIDLARALVSMTRPGHGGPAARPADDRLPGGEAGDGLLAIHGGDSLERLHRLLTPPPPLTAAARTAIAASAGLVLLAPPAMAMFDRYVAWLPGAL